MSSSELRHPMCAELSCVRVLHDRCLKALAMLTETIENDTAVIRGLLTERIADGALPFNEEGMLGGLRYAVQGAVLELRCFEASYKLTLDYKGTHLADIQGEDASALAGEMLAMLIRREAAMLEAIWSNASACCMNATEKLQALRRPRHEQHQ